MPRTRQPASEAEDLAFAQEVDRLGALGLRQAEIAARLGLTVWQVRARLRRQRLVLRAETRVWYWQQRVAGRRFRRPDGELV